MMVTSDLVYIKEDKGLVKMWHDRNIWRKSVDWAQRISSLVLVDPVWHFRPEEEEEKEKEGTE